MTRIPDWIGAEDISGRFLRWLSNPESSHAIAKIYRAADSIVCSRMQADWSENRLPASRPGPKKGTISSHVQPVPCKQTLARKTCAPKKGRTEKAVPNRAILRRHASRRKFNFRSSSRFLSLPDIALGTVYLVPHGFLLAGANLLVLSPAR